MDKDFTLVIAEVFPEDSGIFKCVATNAEGTTTTESRLEVERELPVFGVFIYFPCLIWWR